ncbi:MAG: vWA domain-containing protein [Candidatus Limnocylindria bacterium]
MAERGERIRYSRWDGTQRLDGLEAEELLGAMSDELLSGGDLEDALARLARWGIPGRMEGMQDLLERLREARQRRAERHGLSGIFDELKEKLEEVKRLEREGLERRRSAEAPNEDLRRAMDRLAEERLAKLDALPEDVGRAIRELKDYEFIEPKAAEKYRELLEQLQQQVLGSYFKNMRESLKGLSPEQLERTRQMIRDLDRALRERMEGGEPDFEAFQRQYPELAGGAKDWDDLLRQLAAGMAAMRSLWRSMSPEMREQLEELLGTAFDDPGLQQAMNDLADTLAQLVPMEGYPHDLSGDEPLTLAEALGLMDEMNQLSDLDESVRSARAPGDLEAVDRDQVERLAGQGARQALEDLQRMTALLEEAGLIRKDGERYELTPRGIRKIGQRSLEEIFATLKRDAFGRHRARSRGRGGDPTDEAKRYEFGDPFLLDLPGTVRNAVIRDAGEARAEGRERHRMPLRLRAEDFDVYRTELVTQSATAILVDVSRSMLFRGCFLAAKKVTLALDSLIRSAFPKDDLYIVGFSAYAVELKPADLPRLAWNEFVYGTNMQHAFLTARTLLGRSRGKNKQIILITDGEPTAHFEPGTSTPRFAYPPTKRTFEETLREVVRCTRESITINTFMLARGHYLMDFVNQMSKINRGRAFYVEPERLGEYILVDYVTNKRRRVA